MKFKNGIEDRQNPPSSEQIKLYSEKHYSKDFRKQILSYKIGAKQLHLSTDTTKIYKNSRTVEIYENSTQ